MSLLDEGQLANEREERRAKSRGQRSVRRGSLGASSPIAGGTHSFHLSAQHHHSRSDAFVLLRRSCDCPVDGALVHKALQFFIRTQTQHLFAATSRISLPHIKEHSFEQGLEFERGLRRKHSDQLLGNAVWRPTCKRESRSFRHQRLSHRSWK